MITLNNARFDSNQIKQTDLFICNLNYEQRSEYIYNTIMEKAENDSFLIFSISNALANERINRIKKYNQIIDLNYEDSEKFFDKVIQTINTKMQPKKALTIDIDYSSMPRSWYCGLPDRLEKALRPNDIIRFWYSEGIYPTNYEEYPTSGIESYRHFSGKPSLIANRKRAHIVALSYDFIRTQGIISILDPEYLVTCEAHDPKQSEIKNNIVRANSIILDRTSMSISFDITDFKFMISKLKELSNEMLWDTDVILVPDGPKPLVFTMSMIPWLLNKEGITCMHIQRNLSQFKPIDVSPSKDVVGFEMCICEEDK